MKYQLSVEVKLQEIPEQPEPITIQPGEDPMHAAGAIMNRLTATVIPTPSPFFMGSNAGFDFRKTTTLSVANFQSLAAVIGKFDELVHDVELDSLQVQP